MKRLLVVSFLATLLTAPASADVPERFQGTWALDTEASLQAIEAAGDELTAEQRERLIRGVTKELVGFMVEVTDSALTYKIPGHSQAATLTLQEETDNGAVFSSPEADTVTFTMTDDGRLNTRSSKDDDFDLFYFSRQDGAAEAVDAPSTDSVAYLDALKGCSPGEFHLSFPGMATFENTIVGKKNDSCELRIVHPDFTLNCEYSEEMIGLLTTEKMYEEARSGVLSGSTDSRVSELAAEQCLQQ